MKNHLTVRLTQTIELHKSDLQRYIGKLEKTDIISIKLLLSMFGRSSK